jgi:hypothetical protein
VITLADMQRNKKGWIDRLFLFSLGNFANISFHTNLFFEISKPQISLLYLDLHFKFMESNYYFLI